MIITDTRADVALSVYEEHRRMISSAKKTLKETLRLQGVGIVIDSGDVYLTAHNGKKIDVLINPGTASPFTREEETQPVGKSVALYCETTYLKRGEILIYKVDGKVLKIPNGQSFLRSFSASYVGVLKV